jgi:hypothetical protein
MKNRPRELQGFLDGAPAMSEEQVLERLGNLDHRVDRIEQFLPTLATRDEVCVMIADATTPLATKAELLATKAELRAAIDEAVANLATKDELREAVAKLATKEELHEAVAKLATKEELHEAVAKLATKEELHGAVAKLATKEELHGAVAKLATKEELGEEGERSRRYMLMLFEDMRGEIRLFADAYGVLDRRDARQHTETTASLGGLDLRVTALETKGRRRRVQ